MPDDVEELHRFLFFEVCEGRHIDKAEFNASFDTGLCFAGIVSLDGCEFFRSIDRFVVKDAVEFKGKTEMWYEDVEFSIDGVFPVEMEFDGRIENRELLL